MNGVVSGPGVPEAGALAVVSAVAGPEPERAALSPREVEVVALVAQGLGNKDIALRLGISLYTVSSYLRRIFLKLGVSSRAQMVARVMAGQDVGTVGPELVTVLSGRVQRAVDGLDGHDEGAAVALRQALEDLQDALLDDFGDLLIEAPQVVVACALLGELR